MTYMILPASQCDVLRGTVSLEILMVLFASSDPTEVARSRKTWHQAAARKSFPLPRFYPYYPAGTFTRPDSDAANTDASDSVNNTGDSAGEEAGDDGNSTIV